MDTRFCCFYVFFIVQLVSFVSGSLSVPECHEDIDCGWNTVCLNGGHCACRPGYILSNNDRDCVDPYCDDASCIECLARQICRRCVHYVEEGTGKCVDTCDNSYKLAFEGNQVGKLCPVRESMWSAMYIAIIVGVIAALLLVTVLIIACYWKFKSDKERKLRFEMLNKELLQQKARTQKQVSEYTSFDNPAYDSLSPSNRRSHLTMLQNMSLLRRHIDTLIIMYKEAKLKTRTLPPESRPSFQYRNIVHHLGRVILLLRDPDPDLTPESGQMFTWAIKLLQDYKMLKNEHLTLTIDRSRSSTYDPCVTPGSSLARLTSAFQTLHGLDTNSLPPMARAKKAVRSPDYNTRSFDYNDLNNGHIRGDVSPSTTTMSFTYERNAFKPTTFQSDRELGEISFINLHGNYTKPINV